MSQISYCDNITPNIDTGFMHLDEVKKRCLSRHLVRYEACWTQNRSELCRCDRSLGASPTINLVEPEYARSLCVQKRSPQHVGNYNFVTTAMI